MIYMVIIWGLVTVTVWFLGYMIGFIMIYDGDIIINYNHIRVEIFHDSHGMIWY